MLIQITEYEFFYGLESTTVSSLVTLANNEVNKQAGLHRTYQGINIGDADGNALNDVSSMEYLHVDYWSADLDGIDFFLIGGGVRFHII